MVVRCQDVGVRGVVGAEVWCGGGGAACELAFESGGLLGVVLGLWV